MDIVSLVVSDSLNTYPPEEPDGYYYRRITHVLTEDSDNNTIILEL